MITIDPKIATIFQDDFKNLQDRLPDLKQIVTEIELRRTIALIRAINEMLDSNWFFTAMRDAKMFQIFETSYVNNLNAVRSFVLTEQIGTLEALNNVLDLLLGVGNYSFTSGEGAINLTVNQDIAGRIYKDNLDETGKRIYADSGGDTGDRKFAYGLNYYLADTALNIITNFIPFGISLYIETQELNTILKTKAKIKTKKLENKVKNLTKRGKKNG